MDTFYSQEYPEDLLGRMLNIPMMSLHPECKMAINDDHHYEVHLMMTVWFVPNDTSGQLQLVGGVECNMN